MTIAQKIFFEGANEQILEGRVFSTDLVNHWLVGLSIFKEFSQILHAFSYMVFAPILTQVMITQKL